MVKRNFSIEQIARDVIHFLSPHVHVDRLILFGSYADGSNGEDSDIDLAIISSDFEKMKVMEKIDLLSRVPLAVDSRIEALGFATKDFLKPAMPSLLDVIKRKGKALFVRQS